MHLKRTSWKDATLSNDATNIYSIKSLKLKLQEKYKDYIYFSEMPGRENAIAFRQMTNLSLSELKKRESQTKDRQSLMRSIKTRGGLQEGVV